MTSPRARCKTALGWLTRLRTEQPLITCLAGLALLVMISQTALSDIPEPFAGAAKIGKLCYDLALAFFAAWMFNVLVVVVPRWRDQARILQVVGRHIQGVASGARSVLQAMASSANLPLSATVTRQEVHSLCEATDPNSNAPMVTSANGELGPVTWLAMLQIDASRVARFQELLVPAYLYFDAELVAMLRRASTASYLEQIRLAPAAPVSNTDLTWLADALYDYSELCRHIDEYYESQVKQCSVSSTPAVDCDLYVGELGRRCW